MDMSKFNIDISSLPVGKELTEEEYQLNREIELGEKMLNLLEKGVPHAQLDALAREYGFLCYNQYSIWSYAMDEMRNIEFDLDDVNEYIAQIEFDCPVGMPVNKWVSEKAKAINKRKRLEKKLSTAKANAECIKRNALYRLYFKNKDKTIPPRSRKEIEESLYGDGTVYDGETGKIVSSLYEVVCRK